MKGETSLNYFLDAARKAQNWDRAALGYPEDAKGLWLRVFEAFSNDFFICRLPEDSLRLTVNKGPFFQGFSRYSLDAHDSLANIFDPEIFTYRGLRAREIYWNVRQDWEKKKQEAENKERDMDGEIIRRSI